MAEQAQAEAEAVQILPLHVGHGRTSTNWYQLRCTCGHVSYHQNYGRVDYVKEVNHIECPLCGRKYGGRNVR